MDIKALDSRSLMSDHDAEANAESEAAGISSVFVFHQQAASARKKFQALMTPPGGATEMRCLPVIGPTGSGKSKLLKTLTREKEWESSRLPSGIVVPKLVVKCPQHPTNKGLAEAILLKFGAKIYPRETETHMTNRVLLHIQNAGTKLVIIEEAQHMASAPGNGKYESGDFLKILLIDTACRLVLEGLPTVKDLVKANKQLQRRSWPAIELRPLDWRFQQSQSDWRSILKQIGAQYFPAISLSEVVTAQALNWATRGLLGDLEQLLNTALMIAGDQDATHDDLRAAWDAIHGEDDINTDPNRGELWFNPWNGESIPANFKPADFLAGTFEVQEEQPVKRRKK